ncbi:MAG: hypothetical protein LC127_14115 [Chitinophagales bacterium]|nr:hypothetical protein [Chitinophagales bacterium]
MLDEIDLKYIHVYEIINWKAARNKVCNKDEYTKKNWLLRQVYRLLNTYERVHLKGLRKKALRFILSYIEMEDRQTNYINIGPVNKVINSISVWYAHGESDPAFQKHVDRWMDYLWIAEDGMKMNGYNGSQLWDTAFVGLIRKPRQACD